jgi:DNA-binding response OmpR family regulator
MAVLVIDDDRKGLTSVVERLRHAGFETIDASTGEEAFQLLETKLDIAFVFANPEADGEVALEALEPLIRRRCPHLAILPSQTVDELVRNVVPFARSRGAESRPRR